MFFFYTSGFPSSDSNNSVIELYVAKVTVDDLQIKKLQLQLDIKISTKIICTHINNSPIINWQASQTSQLYNLSSE